jgi:hypothetical protein
MSSKFIILSIIFPYDITANINLEVETSFYMVTLITAWTTLYYILK